MGTKSMNATFLPYSIPIIELIAVIFATVHFKKYAASNERYFLYFLWFTFLIDVTGTILNHFSIDNKLVYEVFTIGSFLFYFYWFNTILKNKTFKSIAKFSAIMFLGVTLIAYILPSYGGQGYAFVTGAICILLLTFLHLFQLLRGDEILVVKYKLSFWITTALLLFYVGIIPLILLSQYLNVEGASRTVIFISLNIILYGCYIIGFIWTKKKYNRF